MIKKEKVEAIKFYKEVIDPEDYSIDLQAPDPIEDNFEEIQKQYNLARKTTNIVLQITNVEKDKKELKEEKEKNKKEEENKAKEEEKKNKEEVLLVAFHGFLGFIELLDRI